MTDRTHYALAAMDLGYFKNSAALHSQIRKIFPADGSVLPRYDQNCGIGLRNMRSN
jgi:hypothetical protein